MRPNAGGKLPAGKTGRTTIRCLSDADGARVRRRSLDRRRSFACHAFLAVDICLVLCHKWAAAFFTHRFHFQGHFLSF